MPKVGKKGKSEDILENVGTKEGIPAEKMKE